MWSRDDKVSVICVCRLEATHKSERDKMAGELFSWLVMSLLLVANAEVFLLRRQSQEANDSKVELSCFYNGPQSESVGLGWVLPAATSHITQTSERWRHTTRAGLVKGHFEYYGHVWLSTTSLNVRPPNVFPPVLDERWNEFPEIRTSGAVDFSPPVLFNTDRVHLSVLARRDAHIVLHSGTSPYNSPAYWLSLDNLATSTPVSAIRKCVHGLPRSLLPRYIDCKQIRNSHQGIEMLRQGKQWVHLRIQLTRTEREELTIKLSVVGSTDFAVKSLAGLSWTDPTPIANLRYLSVRTQGTPGLWKVHDYRVVVHNGESDGEGFNVFELSEPHQSCLQLFYFLRPGFGDASATSKDKNQTIKLAGDSSAWQVLKVSMHLKPPSDHIHFVPPLWGSVERIGAIFAISQPFRICGDEEFFVSKISAEPEQLEGASCTNLKTLASATVHNGTSRTLTVADCPDNKFGKSCNISCGRVVGDYTCRGKVICDARACSCLSGYQPTDTWDSTCHSSIPGVTTPRTDGAPSNVTMLPTLKTSPADDFEVAAVTEASVDEDPGEEAPAEAASRSAEGSKCSSRDNTAVIVLSVITAALLVCGVLAAWYWHSRVGWRNPQALNIVWKQQQPRSEHLIEDLPQDDINP